MCLEAAPTQAVLHSLGIPLRGYGAACLPTGLGGLGWEQPAQHSSANWTGVQGSILQRPVPATVPAHQGWGSVLAPPSPSGSSPGHATAPRWAAVRPGPYVPVMPPQCCCQG